MEIVFLKIGKPAYSEYGSLVAEYEKRLGRFARIEGKQVRESDNPKKMEQAILKATENSTLICLDERGERKTSKSIAESLKQYREDSRVKRLCFVIGGPYGLSERVLQSATERWRLSDCTLTSDMAWLMTLEQVYRGFMILSGSGYHHE